MRTTRLLTVSRRIPCICADPLPPLDADNSPAPWMQQTPFPHHLDAGALALSVIHAGKPTPLSCDQWCMFGSQPPHPMNRMTHSVKTLPCPKHTTHLKTVHALGSVNTSWCHFWEGVGPQMYKFEQASSDHHQMSLEDRVGPQVWCPGWGIGPQICSRGGGGGVTYTPRWTDNLWKHYLLEAFVFTNISAWPFGLVM